MTKENYRKLGIVECKSEIKNNRSTITLAHFYVVQENGRKKHYRGIPGGYLEGVLDGKVPKIEKYGLINVSAELIQTLDFVLQLERTCSKNKNPISVEDFINRQYLRNGIIPLKQMKKVRYKYNWKAA